MNEVDNKQLTADFEAQKKDFAFFEKGVPFSEVRVCSAKSVLGGNWRDIIKQYLGEETLHLLAERSEGKDGKAIDFPLAAFNVENKAGLFSKGEKISVVCRSKKYSGSYEVLAIEDNFVIILKGKDGEASGTIINLSRKNGAAKAMEKTAKRLSKVEGNGTNDNKTDKTTESGKKNDKESKPRRYRYGWLLLIATILLILFFTNKKQ